VTVSCVVPVKHPDTFGSTYKSAPSPPHPVASTAASTFRVPGKKGEARDRCLKVGGWRFSGRSLYEDNV
jgi:hypothetical protein